MNWLTKVFVLMAVLSMVWGQLDEDGYNKEDKSFGDKYKTEENQHQSEFKDVNNGTESVSAPESQPESGPRPFTRRRIVPKTNVNGRCESCRTSTSSSRKRSTSQGPSNVFPRENKYSNAGRFGVTNPSADTTSDRRFTQNRNSQQSINGAFSTQIPPIENNFRNQPVTSSFSFGTAISSKNEFAQNPPTKNNFDTDNFSRNNFKRQYFDPGFQPSAANFGAGISLPEGRQNEANFGLNVSPNVEASTQSSASGVIVSSARNSNEFDTNVSVGNVFGSHPSLPNSFGIQGSVGDAFGSQSFPESGFSALSPTGNTFGGVTASVLNVGTENPNGANRFLSSTASQGILGGTVSTSIQEINSGLKQHPTDASFGSDGSSLTPDSKIELNSNFPDSNNFRTGITVENRFIVDNLDENNVPNVHQNTTRFSSLTSARDDGLGTSLSDGRLSSNSATASTLSAERNFDTGNPPGFSSAISGSSDINAVPNTFGDRSDTPNSNLPNLSVNFGIKQKNGTRKFITFPSQENLIRRVNPESFNTFFSTAATTTPLPPIPSFNVSFQPPSSEGGSGSSNVSFRFTPQTNASVQALVGSLLNVLSSLVPSTGARSSQPAGGNGTPRFPRPPQQSVSDIPNPPVPEPAPSGFSSSSDVRASRNRNSLSADETKIDFNINTFIQIGSK